MRLYEGYFLFDPSLGHDALADVLKRFQDSLKKYQGKAEKVIDPKKVTLGVAIRKKTSALGYTVYFRMPSDQVRLFHDELRLVPEILRFNFLAIEALPVEKKLEKEGVAQTVIT